MPEIQAEMPMTRFRPKRFGLYLLAIALGIACLSVLWPFASVITWSVILAYVSWPVYRAFRRPFGRFQGAAAICMTIVLTCAVILPALWLFVLIAGELVSAYRSLETLLAEKTLVLPEIIHRIPWLGEQLQGQFDRFSAEPSGFGTQVATWAQTWTSQITALAGSVGRSVGKLFLVMLAVFFLYRDGDSILVQLRRVVRRAFGNRLDGYVRTAGSMTRAVLFGFLITAFVQGLIAGIGYAILGIHGSVLLGAITGVLSFIPLLGTAVCLGQYRRLSAAHGSRRERHHFASVGLPSGAPNRQPASSTTHQQHNARSFCRGDVRSDRRHRSLGSHRCVRRPRGPRNWPRHLALMGYGSRSAKHIREEPDSTKMR